MDIILSFPLICIICCLVCSVVSSVVSGRAARYITLGLILFVLVLNSILLLHNLNIEESVTFIMGHFTAPWGNEIRFGIIEPLLSIVFSLTIFLSVLGGRETLADDIGKSKSNIYYTMIDLVQVAVLALVYTNDIFTGYVFIEICTLSSCGILIIRQIGRTTLAAVRYMIFSLVGSGLFLLSVILLYQITGHLLMPQLKESVSLIWSHEEYKTTLVIIMGLMTIGLSIKSGLFPFHLWMPDTYGYSTPASACILSGVISKAYICLLIKAIFEVFGTDVYYAGGAGNIVFVLGCLGVIVGSISAIQENDINRMNAYSSAAQIGYIYMGIGMSPAAGMIAAVYHIILHALTKPLLFTASAGLVRVSGGSKKFADLTGAGRRDMVSGIGFSVGAFSMVGIPLFAGFISKLLFARGAFIAGNKMLPVLIVLALSTILNIIYYLRTVIRIYSIPQAGSHDSVYETVPHTKAASMHISIIIFTVINFILGLFSDPLVQLIERGLELLG